MTAENYEKVLDSLAMTGIYVIREDNHQILYFNKRVRKVAPDVRLGMVCHEIWAGSCDNCPILSIGDRKQSASINYDDPFGKVVDIVATRMLWDGKIPAFSIAVTPHADAFTYTYNKILKANLTTDSFDIMKMEAGEQKPVQPEECSLSSWFQGLVKSGKIYHRDVKRFQKFVRADYLRTELQNGRKMMICTYRYRDGKGFRWHTIEIVPDSGYTDENQTVMLYVKDVHDVYRKGLELEEINIQNQEIIKTLGELNFGVYVIDLQNGMLNPVRIADDMKQTVQSRIYDWDELFARMVEEHFHPKDKALLMENFSVQALKQTQMEGRKKNEILCRRMLDGKYRYVQATAHFSKTADETPCVIFALRDVDEQTRQEIRHIQNDQRMAAIIKSTYRVMNLVNLDNGLCERFYLDEEKNPGWVQTGDYQFYIDKAAREIVHPEDEARFRETMSLEVLRKKAEEAGDFKEYVYQFRYQGEGSRWVEEHLFFIRQEQAVTVNILSKDITDEKRREEAIAREKRERNYIIDSMSSLFFVSYYLDLESNVYHALTEKADVRKTLREEMRCTEGFRLYAERYVHPDDRAEYLANMNTENIRKTLSRENPFFAIEYRRIFMENGEIRDNGWIRATVVLSETKNGMPEKALYVAQDVTESKKKEAREHQALREACDAAIHANAAKSEFLSRMSHDIRTPMNAIIGMTAIAGTHLEDKGRVSDCLEKITTASRHLLSLINEVLDMSKIESGKIALAEEEFNLSDLIQNLLTMIRPAVEAKKHDLTLHLTNIEHEEVIGDAMRLQQVLMNILGNAVKYTPEGGRLELELSEKPSGSYGYSCYEFVCQDNGIGMSEEFLNRIFDPFSRAEDSRVSKIEGTGLGMTIARTIVQMMNGDIRVESRVGEGSKFTVTVCLRPSNITVNGAEHLADLRVLVVDDEPYDAETACMVLNDIGMKSEWVQSGQEAVEHVRSAHQSGDDFFAVILDWKMPGMDGVETARIIRKEVGPDVTIIILSAYDWNDVESEARQAGVDGFISKPLFKSRLIYLLKRFAGKNECQGAGEADGQRAFDFSGKRILLVEDNEINREIAKEIVGSTGAEVICMPDGKQALDEFARSPEWYYDLIFMDIQMPVMNGHEASEAIRRLKRRDAAEIPIIAMTANAFAEDAIASRRAGMNEHVTKPLDVGELMKCMRRWLMRRRRDISYKKG